MTHTYIVCDICGKTEEVYKAMKDGWFTATISHVTGEMRIVCPEHTHGLRTQDVRAMWLANFMLADCNTQFGDTDPERCFKYHVDSGHLIPEDKEEFFRGVELSKDFIVKATKRAVEGQEAHLWDAVPVDAVAVKVDAGYIATSPAVRIVYAVPRK